jgi:hypothetical protein
MPSAGPVGLAAISWVDVIFCLLERSPGPNQHGPPPVPGEAQTELKRPADPGSRDARLPHPVAGLSLRPGRSGLPAFTGRARLPVHAGRFGLAAHSQPDQTYLPRQPVRGCPARHFLTGPFAVRSPEAAPRPSGTGWLSQAPARQGAPRCPPKSFPLRPAAGPCGASPQSRPWQDSPLAQSRGPANAPAPAAGGSDGLEWSPGAEDLAMIFTCFRAVLSILCPEGQAVQVLLTDAGAFRLFAERN